MKGLIFSVLVFLFLSFGPVPTIYSQVDDDLQQKKDQISELEAKLQQLNGEKQTLASTLSYLETKIELTKQQVAETNATVAALRTQIEGLKLQIAALNTSLKEVSAVLVNRISETYKRARTSQYVVSLKFSVLRRLLSEIKYLELLQKQDRQLLYQMESTRIEFKSQKELKEEKQEELDKELATLEQQERSLTEQQKQKQYLLEVTKTDEKNFQKQLSEKRAELEAIQSIIAGKGDETKVGSIDKGATIAQVIPGASTCSSGSHLHLEVAAAGVHRNPALYLKSQSVIWDNTPDGSFDFSGGWDWPLKDPIRITQGYGMTFYAATMRYYGGAPHTGIDMINTSDYSVRAVEGGTLYRGAISCRGGKLRYVRVEHSQDISSYYLHVNY